MNNLNKENMENRDDDLDFIKKLKPMEAKKSKDEVWTELQEIMEQPFSQQAKVQTLNFRKWSVAASLALLVSLTGLSVMRFYTKNTTALAGEQIITYLPDGSKVQLNSKSELSYHPFWWAFNREVTLSGEGFFEVKKGEKFTVVSAQGETNVLGTSFNIFAREKDYQVTCLTGKVRVLNARNNDEVIITPNQMVALNQNGKLTSNINIDAKIALDWTEGKFIFTQEPLKNVLAEIGRRYGVEFENIDNLNEPYTGYFKRQKDIENVLNIVCKPFNIEYKKLPSGAYTIQ
jgi:transmembrane sensor